jgi:hypothetical protein
MTWLERFKEAFMWRGRWWAGKTPVRQKAEPLTEEQVSIAFNVLVDRFDDLQALGEAIGCTRTVPWSLKRSIHSPTERVIGFVVDDRLAVVPHSYRSRWLNVSIDGTPVMTINKHPTKVGCLCFRLEIPGETQVPEVDAMTGADLSRLPLAGQQVLHRVLGRVLQADDAIKEAHPVLLDYVEKRCR